MSHHKTKMFEVYLLPNFYLKLVLSFSMYGIIIFDEVLASKVFMIVYFYFRFA